MFSLIACIGRNHELGKDGDLIFHLKDDMKFFRETTSGHKVIMGRKTWDSLPVKLKNRENIVISRSDFSDSTPDKSPDRIMHDLPTFISENQDSGEEIFIIGGSTIYKAFLPYAKNLYLTEVDASVSDADTFFPDFDKTNYSRELIKKGKENDLAYSIIKYIKN